MIPSVYSEVEAYKREGRINAEAAYSALGMDKQAAKRTSLTGDTQLQLDSFVYADEKLSKFFRHGCTHSRFYETVCMSVEAACEWNCKPLYELRYPCVERYMCECARSNLDNPIRGKNAVSEMISRNADQGFDAKALLHICWSYYVPDLFNPTEDSIKALVDKVEKHFRKSGPFYLGCDEFSKELIFHVPDGYPILSWLKKRPNVRSITATMFAHDTSEEILVESDDAIKTYPFCMRSKLSVVCELKDGKLRFYEYDFLTRVLSTHVDAATLLHYT